MKNTSCRLIKPRIVAFILATVFAVSVSCVFPVADDSTDTRKTIDTSAKSFSDVSYRNWYFGSVMQAVQMGFVNGYEDGTYMPKDKITRAQICQILYNYRGNGASVSLSIDDVEPFRWYYDSVCWAVSQELILMHSGGKFEPDAALTREELIYALYVLAGRQSANIDALDGFTDVNAISTTSYKIAFAWSVSNKIIYGVTSTTLEPRSSTTRAEVAGVMVRYADIISHETVPEIDSAVMNGQRNPDGSTIAANVNSLTSVGKSEDYPTIGQADKANANGYLTEADVDISGAVLCYDALDCIHRQLGNYGLVWTTSDELEEYTLLRAKEVFGMLAENSWTDIFDDDGLSPYHKRPDGSLTFCAENLGFVSNASSDYASYTEDVVTSWIASSEHYSLVKYNNIECCIARYENVWVYTIALDGTYDTLIADAGNNYVRDTL